MNEYFAKAIALMDIGSVNYIMKLLKSANGSNTRGITEKEIGQLINICGDKIVAELQHATIECGCELNVNKVNTSVFETNLEKIGYRSILSLKRVLDLFEDELYCEEDNFTTIYDCVIKRIKYLREIVAVRARYYFDSLTLDEYDIFLDLKSGAELIDYFNVIKPQSDQITADKLYDKYHREPVKVLNR